MPEPNLERLPFDSSSEDWRGYCEADTRTEADAIMHGRGSHPPIWIQKSLVYEQAGLLDVCPQRTFFELGTALLAWLSEVEDTLGDGDVLELGVCGAPRPVEVGWMDGSLYAWRQPHTEGN